MSQLADWKCHKIVKAGKILAFGPGFNGPVTVEDVHGAECKVEVTPNVFARGRPNLGDYIVIYEDGYKSWSPAKAFEEGYTRPTDCPYLVETNPTDMSGERYRCGVCGLSFYLDYDEMR